MYIPIPNESCHVLQLGGLVKSKNAATNLENVLILYYCQYFIVLVYYIMLPNPRPSFMFDLIALFISS